MAYNQYYPHLFEPMYVGKKKIRFKNRIFGAPMSTEAEPVSHIFTDDAIDFYCEKARGGLACVSVGELRLDRVNSCAHSAMLDITDVNSLPQHHKFNNYAHVYGCRTSAELNHDGHFSVPAFNDGHTPPMSASAMTMPDGTQVREMNEEDMDYVAGVYADAASMAIRAGYDVITMHFGHGWLMGGWLSPLVNKRTDMHGGCVENRIRFPRMVLERIRKRVGDEILIEVRMSGDEKVPGGITIEDTIYYIKAIEDLIDMVHISSGTRFVGATRCFTHPTNFVPAGHTAMNAYRVKQAGVKIPVGCVGGINTPELAEQLIADGMVDYVLLGRSLVVDDNWANKAEEGRSADIRPCMRCSYCQDGALRKAISDSVEDDDTRTMNFGCAANPLYGQYAYLAKFPPAGIVKDVVIIGGGFAGMQAALKAHERGHKVRLYEKTGRLGGLSYCYADYEWYKKEVVNLRNYFIKQLTDAGIEIHLNTEMTPDEVERLKPDVVIVAVGSEPLVPPIPGVDQKHVIPATEVLLKKEQVGKRVVIIGGGQAGCELAYSFGEDGRECTVLEMKKHLAADSVFTARMHLLMLLEANEKIHTMTQTTCTEITSDGVWVEDVEGKRSFIEADTVILSTGMKPKVAERDSFEGCAFDVIPIGDCLQPGLIKDAIRTGFDAALSLHKTP